MKILVTGHCGYIGSVLTPMLVEAGFDVHGLDSQLFKRCVYPEDNTWASAIPSINKDVRDIILDDLEGFDVIVHLAGLSNDPLGDFMPGVTDEINHKATINIATLAKAAGVERFIFASSCSNYGASGNQFLDENASFNPVTPYGQSKVDAEYHLSQLADDRFSPVYLRASTAYGLSPLLRFDLVVNNLTAWAIATGKVFLKSNGLSWRPLVHVEDIARAYIAAITAPKENIHNEAFNVGLTTENFLVKDIAEMVHRIVPNCTVTFSNSASDDKRSYRVDCNKIAQQLPGFKPQWTV